MSLLSRLFGKRKAPKRITVWVHGHRYKMTPNAGITVDGSPPVDWPQLSAGQRYDLVEASICRSIRQERLHGDIPHYILKDIEGMASSTAADTSPDTYKRLFDSFARR